MAETEPGIILFDGVCNLCNRAVDFILRRDPDARFRFAPLQSAVGQRLLRDHGLPTDTLNTIVLVTGGQAFLRSDAALRIASGLSGPARLWSRFLWVPRPLRDGVYKFIARHRYGWFGKRDTCRLPTPDERARFLDPDGANLKC